MHLTQLPGSGLRLPVRGGWPGLVRQVELTAGNKQELAQELPMADDLPAGTSGLMIGDWVGAVRRICRRMWPVRTT
jgi:hypothetical protein